MLVKPHNFKNSETCNHLPDWLVNVKPKRKVEMIINGGSEVISILLTILCGR